MVIMNELLTSKQVQDLLSIDRTTVYRMLKDGRLSGVKVGNQWRFHTAQVNELISMPDTNKVQPARPMTELPLHCMQLIQNIFAQVVDIGAVTIELDGNVLTEISNCSRFCSLILGSESGRQACRLSRQQLLKASKNSPEFFQCHAGLHYKSHEITLAHDSTIAFMAGQFYSEAPDLDEQTARVRHLAFTHIINPDQLSEAIKDIPVLDARKRSQMGVWLQEVANTFSELCHERTEVLNRLKVISEMSNLDLPASIS